MGLFWWGVCLSLSVCVALWLCVCVCVCGGVSIGVVCGVWGVCWCGGGVVVLVCNVWVYGLLLNGLFYTHGNG